MPVYRHSLISLLLAASIVATALFPAIPPNESLFRVALAQESDDGLIAYIGPDGNVWLISSDGTKPTRVTDDAVEDTAGPNTIRYCCPSWSPDGRLLAFARTDRSNTMLSLRIYTIASGSSQDLQDVSAYIAWKADSSGFAFTIPCAGGWQIDDESGDMTLACDERFRGIWQMDLESGRKSELVPPRRGYILGHPVWSPDGRYLSFEESGLILGEPGTIEGHGLFALYEIDTKSYIPWGESIGNYSWSPKGDYLVYDQVAYYSELGSRLWRSDVNGNNRVPLTPVNASTADRFPRVSPTGDRIAFFRGEPDPYWTPLWIVNTDGTNVHQATPFEVRYAAWSPDGQKLAVEAGAYPEREISVLNLITGETRKIADGSDPVWQPRTFCGNWTWKGPMKDKDLRIETTSITEASGDDCYGAFRLKNLTATYGGYALELQVRHENAEFTWEPRLLAFGDSKELINLAPSLPVEIHNAPLNPNLEASIHIQGNITLKSFSYDLALFLLKSAFEILDPGVSCLVPKEQLFFAAMRVSGIVDKAAELILKGDFLGAKQELVQIGGEFYERAADALTKVGIECAVELLAQIAKKPAIIAKIVLDYLAWVPVIIFDYFKYQGQPADVLLVYTPSLPKQPTPTPRPTETPIASIDQIAFVSDRDGDSDIYLMDTDGSELINLTNNSDGDGGPAWSPDGQQLAFVSDRSGVSAIYVMDADGTGVRQLANLETGGSGPVWSPDGGRIAFRSGGLSYDNLYIYWINSDGTGLTKVYSQPGYGSRIAWSADGQRLLFDANINGDFKLLVVNLDGSGLHTFADSERWDLDPAWSPDGQHVAFVSDRAGGMVDIWSTNQDGSGATNLTGPVGGVFGPVWSRDSQWVAFMSGGYGFHIVRPDGSQLTKVSDLGYTGAGPQWSWSPDSTRIAFAAPAEDNRDIYVVSTDGSGLTNLTNHPAQDSNPVWCPAPAPPEITATQVINFHPTGVTGEELEGTCWTSSLVLLRPDAWRCRADNHIYDPCFSSAEETGAVICGTSPLGDGRGFKLNLTEPLPTGISVPPGQHAWALELTDGTTCTFIQGATTAPEGQRVNYACSDGWFILRVGVWTNFYPYICRLADTKPLHIGVAKGLSRGQISLAKARPPYMGDQRCETPICGFGTKKLSKVQ